MVKPAWELTSEMFLSEDEVDALLDFLRRRVQSACAGESNSAATDELIIQCLVHSGLRNSEFCRLRVADTVTEAGESVLRVHGTPRQDRTVHIPDFVGSMIARYIDEVRPSVIPDGTDANDRSTPFVFNERGKPYERTGLYRRVVKLLTAAGFGDRASVQLLRHTYGYLTYKRTGGNLLFLQRQMGHAHPMVSSVYSDFVDEDYARLANLVGQQSPRD